MQAIDFFKLTEHPTEGAIRVMDVPQKWSDSQPEITRHAPTIGEHTAEVLAEAGVGFESIDSI